MGFCSARLYLQLLITYQPTKKHIGRVTVRNAQKRANFSSFFTFGPIEVTLAVNFCLFFDLCRVARACTNILVLARMQCECNLVTKMTSQCTKKSQKFAILCIFGAVLASSRLELPFLHLSVAELLLNGRIMITLRFLTTKSLILHLFIIFIILQPQN